MRASGYWAGATLALVAELGSLAALAAWGFTVPPGGAARVLLGVGLPVAAAVVVGQVLTTALRPPGEGPRRNGPARRRAGGPPTE
jgi:hypothetical protein